MHQLSAFKHSNCLKINSNINHFTRWAVVPMFLSGLLLLGSCQNTSAVKENDQANATAKTDSGQKNNDATQNGNTQLSQKNKSFMTTIQLKGNPIHTVGALPQNGTEAPDFTLVDTELGDKSLSQYKGKFVILNIFPSVNTGVCAASVRQFNKDAAAVPNAVVLCISKDLPFAQAQFCGAEGIKNVVMLSDFRTDFGHQYGVQMADGPLQGLLSRAVVVINPEGKIIYEQQVPEITEEPNYEKALAAIK